MAEDLTAVVLGGRVNSIMGHALSASLFLRSPSSPVMPLQIWRWREGMVILTGICLIQRRRIPPSFLLSFSGNSNWEVEDANGAGLLDSVNIISQTNCATGRIGSRQNSRLEKGHEV
ncbi:hypothetical protein E2562_002357 [Oryza meyeriana var. granulata]|uniref:Uncharacterized protein n=1 Tax=Oryza meyeriana var. granulata TaxID=110450 RepID=A0A6G1BI76_9ORYZ|nr:hypothetical protein E2562_002357 [Oryza meyeriana var. granulata]